MVADGFSSARCSVCVCARRARANMNDSHGGPNKYEVQQTINLQLRKKSGIDITGPQLQIKKSKKKKHKQKENEK